MDARSQLGSQQFATAVYRTEPPSLLRGLGYEIEIGKYWQSESRGYRQKYLEASHLSSMADPVASRRLRWTLAGADGAEGRNPGGEAAIEDTKPGRTGARSSKQAEVYLAENQPQLAAAPWSGYGGRAPGWGSSPLA